MFIDPADGEARYCLDIRQKNIVNIFSSLDKTNLGNQHRILCTEYRNTDE